MHKVVLITDDKVLEGGTELLRQWHGSSNGWVWIDFHQEDTENEQSLMQEYFDIDSGVIAEAQRDRHPPSFEGFRDYCYLLLKPLDAESDTLDFTTLQLAFFAGKNFLVTRHSKPSPFLEKLRNRVIDSDIDLDSPLSIVTAMGMRVTQRYGKVLLNLEQRLDVIEDEIFDAHTDSMMRELVGYNTGLRKLSRILNYNVAVFDQPATAVYTRFETGYR